MILVLFHTVLPHCLQLYQFLWLHPLYLFLRHQFLFVLLHLMLLVLEYFLFHLQMMRKAVLFFLDICLLQGYPGCLGVGSFDDVGLLLDLDDDLLSSSSVLLEFLRIAGFLWHSDEKWSPSLRWKWQYLLFIFDSWYFLQLIFNFLPLLFSISNSYFSFLFKIILCKCW